jgi:hypothetical protein
MSPSNMDITRNMEKPIEMLLLLKNYDAYVKCNYHCSEKKESNQIKLSLCY